MQLNKKKELAAKTLDIGKDRIVFNTSRLDEVKEAITRQDIRDLKASGAITVLPIKGRKTIVKRKTRRRAGSKKKVVKNRKRTYVLRTRKLRSYISELKKQGKITQEQNIKLRKEIRASIYRSKAHMKDHNNLGDKK